MTQPIPSVSKVTQKYQATIPLSVREALDIRQGDRLAFTIEQGQVILTKVLPPDWDYLNSVSTTRICDKLLSRLIVI